MKNLLIQLPSEPARNYPIFIGAELLLKLEEFLASHFPKSQLVIITDHQVEKMYGTVLAEALLQRGHQVLLLAFQAGEKFKTAKTKAQLEEQMLQYHCGRDTVILALGGGVVGDVAGFVAATYLRGVPYVQLPTTLLAMLDSSVGGKTGINTSHGKNLIGAYWQPSAVIDDLNFLKTLSQKQFTSGFVEAVKMFLTSDRKQFLRVQEQLERVLARDALLLEEIISAAVSIKMGVVERDEKEAGERMILNFGHTIGHALEKVSRYKIMHGYAVALGILVEMKISELLGICSAEDYSVVQKFFAHLKITPALLAKMDPLQILEATRHDKKRDADMVRYILLSKIGEIDRTKGAVVHFVPDAIVLKALNTMKQLLF